MSTWHEYLQQGRGVPEWPYPIEYDKEVEVTADVLVLGGGIAGCHAAISAAKRGAKVAVMEKGATKRSGLGGAGVDHWLGACTNPCSRVTPEDYTDAIMESAHGYACGPARYIDAMESWDALLDMEGMGMQIRDVDDAFKGAAFRDEETKLMFAYDYEGRHSIRVYGFDVKPRLHKEMKRLGVEIHDRVMVTSLLTEGGRQGNRVTGATGINVRTGAFYVFKSKATIVSTAVPTRLWLFAPELIGAGAMRDLNSAGVGHAIGWNAGAEFVDMEHAVPRLMGLGYAPYSMGNASNTYHGSPIVDARGKEVPWVDFQGRELKTVDERFRPGAGQRFMLGQGIGLYYYNPKFRVSELHPELVQRIRNGEYTLPLYMDLTRLPESERRVIFGMMVGNEGKTRIPVYDIFTKAGFDPDRDMLQTPVMPPETYRNANFWAGISYPHYRTIAGGGYLVDWDLRTSLEGLYAAGGCIFGSGAHASAATSGRYAGRAAAAYAQKGRFAVTVRKQVEAEKARVYAPVIRNKGGIGWKELNYAIARIMQDYCGLYKGEETLKFGLEHLKDIGETEVPAACAANPHELGRLLECFSLVTLGQMSLHASLARKASSVYLDFLRFDYPQLDPPDWQKLLSLRQENDRTECREVPFDYHLKPPYASTYRDNYEKHRNSPGRQGR